MALFPLPVRRVQKVLRALFRPMSEVFPLRRGGLFLFCATFFSGHPMFIAGDWHWFLSPAYRPFQEQRRLAL